MSYVVTKASGKYKTKTLLIASGNDAVKEEVFVPLKILSAWVLNEDTCHAKARYGFLLCFGDDLMACYVSYVFLGIMCLCF